MYSFSFTSQKNKLIFELVFQVRKAKETTEDLYGVFAGKNSVSELSSVLIASTRPKIKFIEDTLMQILENLSEQPPLSWLVGISQNFLFNMLTHEITATTLR